MWEAIRKTVVIVIALAALAAAVWPSAAGASNADAPPECHFGAGHELCSDGVACWVPGQAMVRLTPAAHVRIKPDATPAGTGDPDLDQVNARLGVTKFEQVARPGPGTDPSDDVYRWYLASFAGGVREAIQEYLRSGAVEAAEPNGILFLAAAAEDPCQPAWDPGLLAPAPRTAPGAKPPAPVAHPRRYLIRRARRAMKRRHGRFFMIRHGKRVFRIYAQRTG
jgi:hypothetical protein